MPKRSQKIQNDEAIGFGAALRASTRLLRRGSVKGSAGAPELLAMTATKPMDTLSAGIYAYWRGERNLWGAFWVWGMGVGCLIGLFFTLFSGLVLQQAYLNFVTGDVVMAGLAGYAVLVMFGFWWSYYAWHLVSVWRCAAHSCPIAKWGARAFVLAVAGTYWPLYALHVWVRFL